MLQSCPAEHAAPDEGRMIFGAGGELREVSSIPQCLRNTAR
jgi:hypothetical protein